MPKKVRFTPVLELPHPVIGGSTKSYASATCRSAPRRTAMGTPVPSPSPSPSSSPSPPPLGGLTSMPCVPVVPKELLCSSYTILLQESHTSVLAFHMRPDQIACHLQIHPSKVDSPLHILEGQWSTAARCNFILTFKGRPSLDNFASHHDILFAPFGPGCWGATTFGYCQVLFNWVPTQRD